MEAEVTIKDETTALIQGAEVAITWTLPDGTTQNDARPTDVTGVATFPITGGNGEYILTIDDVTKTGFAFDQRQSSLSQVRREMNDLPRESEWPDSKPALLDGGGRIWFAWPWKSTRTPRKTLEKMTGVIGRRNKRCRKPRKHCPLRRPWKHCAPLSGFLRLNAMSCCSVRGSNSIPLLLLSARPPRVTRASPTRHSVSLSPHCRAPTGVRSLRPHLCAGGRLIELTSNEGLVATPLRIDERVLHFLTGINHLDDRLQAFVEPISATHNLPPSQLEVVRRIVQLWANSGNQAPPIVQLCGGEGSGRRTVAALACAEFGLHLHGLRSSDIPASAAERESLARLWDREAVLSHSALFVDADETEAVDCARTLLPFLESARGLLFVCRRDPLRAPRRPIVRFDVRKPSSAEQKDLWQQSLGENFRQLNGQVENVVSQFSLGPRSIQSACAALDSHSGDETEPGPKLWDACRVQSRTRLDDLAQRIDPAAAGTTWSCPKRNASCCARSPPTFGSGRRSTRPGASPRKANAASGISALFAGQQRHRQDAWPPRSSPNELRLDLYRIDLSSGRQQVHRRDGEEPAARLRCRRGRRRDPALRRGRRAVRQAQRGQGQPRPLRQHRGQLSAAAHGGLPRPGHPHHQPEERSRPGLPAPPPLRRRSSPSPMPRSAPKSGGAFFPPSTPTEGLDAEKLARLNVAGGNIRNIALNAAFLAADAGEPVRMTHLLRAARSEYGKLEKPLTESEIGGLDMNRQSPIHLHIEELVLHGFAPGDRHRIGDAVQRELARLFNERQTLSSLTKNTEIDRLDGGTFQMMPGSRPETTGAQVARAVFGGLKQ